jgi:hypothetical protein
VTVPRSVDTARWLWVAAGLLSAVRSYLSLADRQGLRDQVHAVDPTLTMQQVEAAVNGEIILGVLFSAAVVALYVLVANRMRAGKGWARVLLTVFGGIFVLFGALGLIGVGSGLAAAMGMAVDPVQVLLSVAGLAVEAAALVAMWLPTAGRYFREASPRTVLPPAPPPQFLR